MRRNRSVKIYLNEQEHENLKKVARERGMTLGGYARIATVKEINEELAQINFWEKINFREKYEIIEEK